VSAYQCCRGEPKSRLAPRFWEITGYVFPGIILAILPKCPLCLAAWIAAGTGIGLSAAAASHVRALAIILSLAPSLYAVGRLMKNRLSDRTQSVSRLDCCGAPRLRASRRAISELSPPAALIGREAVEQSRAAGAHQVLLAAPTAGMRRIPGRVSAAGTVEVAELRGTV